MQKQASGNKRKNLLRQKSNYLSNSTGCKGITKNELLLL
ncbi:hypothetical protein MSIBF_A4260003 [groundwater metagenome]|uniref:Uncharacterized protein n=1 Tax=groundwater metagenome TaxID=717931 RepID=A0A098EDL9_9ZZZZ